MENLKIDQEDLKVLFIHVKDAYKGMSFEFWSKMTKKLYSKYAEDLKKPLTFSEWINGQIIALTS